MAIDPTISLDYRPQGGQVDPLQAMAMVYGLRNQQQEQQLRGLQIQQQQRSMAAQQAVDQAMQNAFNPDGTFNRDALRQGVVNGGYGHLWPGIDESLTKIEQARANLAETTGKVASARKDYLGALASGVKAAGYTPEALAHGVATAVHDGMLTQADVPQWMNLANDPEGLKNAVDNLIASSPKQQELATQQRAALGRSVRPETFQMTGPDGQPQTVQGYFDAASGQYYGPDRQPVTPSGPKPGAEKGLQSKSVLLDGKPTEVIFDPASGKFLQNGQDVSGRVRPMPPASVLYPKPEDEAPTLTDAGLDAAALNYMKTGQMPPMGMGKAGAGVRAKIINRAAELAAGAPVRTPLDLASNRAGFGADQAALTQLQKSRDAISAFENTALKNIDLFLQQAQKVPDTGIPLLNMPARWASGQVLGGQDVMAYNAARQVAVNEIAKITNNPNLTGQLSDQARKEIENFNPGSATLKQTIAVMNVLKQDMANRATSYDQQIAAIKQRIRTGGGAAQPTPGTAAVPANVQKALSTVGPGKHTLSDGSVWIKALDGTITKGS